MSTIRILPIVLSGALALSLLALAGDAQASPARTATRANARPRVTARARRATRAPARRRPVETPSLRRSMPQGARSLTDPQHLAKVKAEVRKYTDMVMHGDPQPDGTVNLYAAQATLVPVRGIRAKEVQELTYDHGKHTSQRLEVSGVPDGMWRGHLIGTVSTHDMSHLSWADYGKAVQQRIAADRIQVSYDHGPGTPQTVLASGITSKAATAVPLTVPLNKNGITRIIYNRTNAQGHVVGSSDAYVGRIVELSWAGN